MSPLTLVGKVLVKLFIQCDRQIYPEVSRTPNQLPEAAGPVQEGDRGDWLQLCFQVEEKLLPIAGTARNYALSGCEHRHYRSDQSDNHGREEASRHGRYEHPHEGTEPGKADPGV